MEIKEENKRFALYDGETEIGEITWQETPDDVLEVDHTFVNPDYRGQQLAQKLLKAVVEKARREEKKLCLSALLRSRSLKRSQSTMTYWFADLNEKQSMRKRLSERTVFF